MLLSCINLQTREVEKLCVVRLLCSLQHSCVMLRMNANGSHMVTVFIMLQSKESIYEKNPWTLVKLSSLYCRYMSWCWSYFFQFVDVNHIFFIFILYYIPLAHESSQREQREPVNICEYFFIIMQRERKTNKSSWDQPKCVSSPFISSNTMQSSTHYTYTTLYLYS